MADEVDGSDAFSIRCPVDRSVMKHEKAAGLSLDRCPTCGGIWLDLNELARGLAIDAKALSEVDREGKRASHSIRRELACPRDSARLVTLTHRSQAHVEYEQCTICGGIYLDQGELKDLASFTLVERIKSFFA